MVRTTTYTGTVRPRYSSAVGFRIDGKVTERLVEVGQVVRAGEPLAKLDETDIRLAIASLEADLAAAQIEPFAAGSRGVDAIRTVLRRACREGGVGCRRFRA